MSLIEYSGFRVEPIFLYIFGTIIIILFASIFDANEPAPFALRTRLH